MSIPKSNVLGYDILELDPSVCVIENIINADKCNEYIKLMGEIDMEKLDVSYDDNNRNNVQCYSRSLSSLIEKDETYKKYDSDIYSIIHNILEISMKLFPTLNINGDSGYTLRKIYGETIQHIDNLFDPRLKQNSDVPINQIRALSIIIILNDDYSGGMFNFPNQKIQHKLKAGSAIIFPPYWTHPHSVSKVEENKYRYTINTWALGC